MCAQVGFVDPARAETIAVYGPASNGSVESKRIREALKLPNVELRNEIEQAIARGLTGAQIVAQLGCGAADIRAVWRAMEEQNETEDTILSRKRTK